MEWTNIINDPVLSQLPYKIELNEWGKIVMSPASNLHGMLQTSVVILLKKLLPDGKAFVECSIQTSKNVKVADVVWGSADFFAVNGWGTPLSVAPEIVVEVVSPGNSAEELMHKKDLYFEKGAVEVWLCAEDGRMSFYSRKGKIIESLLCPAFPDKVDA